ncbi:MAG TPA: ribonuclease H-like domain-containing protein, partial [Candidatus Acidoferrales bacterium]|nr:ribonuclease H-like domain-containing protein [Candidatus Acidoferrales bacterium]
LAPVEGVDRLSALLGARLNHNHYGEHLSLLQWYSTPEICTPDARSLSLLLPQITDEKHFLDTAIDPEKWLFLDTETTGLSGGTGTYAFMVGIAWWDAGGLQVEQFFLRDLDEEHSMLLELSERLEQRPVLVTFNGKSFDWPLLDTRYRMTRAVPAFSPFLHLDLLHPARQLWRLKLGSVRLKDLERQVLGTSDRRLDWTRLEDIDSSLIPQMYFDYLRGGPAEPLVGIFRHNQMDLRGLAALAGKILGLLDSGNALENAALADTHHPIEVLGLSRIMRKRGHSKRARELYESALRVGLPRPVERLAQRELAQMAKRELDYSRAVSLWSDLREKHAPEKHSEFPLYAQDTQRALESAIEAAEQLAIHYEHRAKEPQRALDLIHVAISELHVGRRDGKLPKDRAAKIEARLTRRLARLKRRCKLESELDLRSSQSRSLDTRA